MNTAQRFPGFPRILRERLSAELKLPGAKTAFEPHGKLIFELERFDDARKDVNTTQQRPLVFPHQYDGVRSARYRVAVNYFVYGDYPSFYLRRVEKGHGFLLVSFLFLKTVHEVLFTSRHRPLI